MEIEWLNGSEWSYVSFEWKIDRKFEWGLSEIWVEFEVAPGAASGVFRRLVSKKTIINFKTTI